VGPGPRDSTGHRRVQLTYGGRAWGGLPLHAPLWATVTSSSPPDVVDTGRLFRALDSLDTRTVATPLLILQHSRCVWHFHLASARLTCRASLKFYHPPTQSYFRRQNASRCSHHSGGLAVKQQLCSRREDLYSLAAAAVNSIGGALRALPECTARMSHCSVTIP
jgi:hypothetical protein